jgi:hypothetical protein
MTPSCRLLDTFSEYLAFWSRVESLSDEEQVAAWADDYMAGCPELLAKQLECYRSEGYDWREIARDRVFPHLAERLPEMRRAHDNLLAVCLPTIERAREILGYTDTLTLVVYVGIGCGAGWATEYANAPAILLGLENIAECGWTDRPSLAGLVAHEVGHLVHEAMRADAGLRPSSGPFWQLYSEGFAQRCEHLTLGGETWHESKGLNPPGWLEWCCEHTAWLAAEFLRRADSHQPVRDFFGSWYELRGWRQCGYYLGHEVVRRLQTTATLDEVAKTEDVDAVCRRALGLLAVAPGGPSP